MAGNFYLGIDLNVQEENTDTVTTDIVTHLSDEDITAYITAQKAKTTKCKESPKW